MIKKIICILILCNSLHTFAQEKTSLKTFGKAITDKFPTTRTFDVQYEQLGTTNFNSKLFDLPFENGRIDNHSRFKVAFNLPFYVSNSKRFVLTSSLRYKYETFDLGTSANTNPIGPFSNDKQEFHYLSGSISATYISTLFKKPIIYNATFTVDGNEKNAQRVKGLITANLVIKKTEFTTMTIGALVSLDPSSIIPVTPIFTYNHKFENTKWDIDFVLPQRLLFRRQLLENGRVSFGTELNSENFYLDLNTPELKGIYELNQLELKSGITYEFRFTPKLYGLFKTGLDNVINTRITKKGERTNKYIYDQKVDPQFYFRLGVSYKLF
ncbi:hypothetical protein AB3G33_13460 [Flavobacterium sp. WC2421]|jgi:hypothetical protein|uniref:Outer membrane protein beta-barrel domain-containing protein n=1 Tax=Flavobacterium sp. WC2409 TaxID=3234139 RepID=A0AB39W680_9FLAO